MIKRVLSVIALCFLYTSLHAQEIADTLTAPLLHGTSAVAQTIHETPIATFPAANLTQQLQGRVSGLFATSTNGRPGSPATLLIRGQNFIYGNSEPHYVVNGVPMTSTQLSTINIEDVESITILKDAITAAQHGVNGGNGVVVIETKKGRQKPLHITTSIETGFSKILKNKFGLMNAQQKLNYEKELGIINDATYNARLPYSVNPMDEVYRTAWLQQYNIQLSGGSKHIDYYLSGGYYAQDGIHYKSDFKRYTLNANITARATKWLNAGINIYWGNEKNTYPLTKEAKRSLVSNEYGLTLASILLNPYEQLKNSDGTYQKTLLGYNVNPLYVASLFDDKLNRTNISGTAFLEILFLKKFKFKSSLILNQYKYDEFTNTNYYFAYYSNNREEVDSKKTLLTQANKLNFSSYLGKNSTHHLNVSLSQELKATDEDLTKYAETHDQVGTLLSRTHTYTKGKTKVLTGMLELKYSYKDYFIFDATYRLDRVDLSSTSEVETAKSWAVGAKWIVYNKPYGILSKLALRGSTGKVPYLPLALTHLDYTSTFMYYGGSPFWETTQTHNLGVDAIFFDNKIRLYTEFYLKNTTDVSTPKLPLGLNTKKAEVENKGFELTLNWDILNHHHYYLSFNTNLTINKNKLKKLPKDELIYMSEQQILKVGKPLGSYYIAQWAGVDPATGDAMWLDHSGNKTASYNYAAKGYIEGKSSIPSKSIGFSINGGYKGFSLNTLFYGIWDIYTYNNNLYYLEISNGYNANNFNLTTRAADYWKHPGDITATPSPYSGAYLDTRLLQNHSYLRLKSLTLSYDFNQRMLRPLKIINACRVFVTAHNLFTITGYRGFTPEVLGHSDYANYPEARTFTWGIKLTFK